MKSPKVSVYIASKNYGKFLGDAIESVLRQTYSDWELLIIDDASTDNTNEVMQLYRESPQVRLFNAGGVGLPAVCNLALREARGEYLIRLDGDDIFEENILHILSNALDRDSNLALVFPDYFLMDEFGEVFSHERRSRVGSANHVFDAPANGACTLIRKKVLEEIGGYREDLGAQDGFDLWSKIIGSTRKFANVNLPLFYYRRHGANLTRDSFRIMNARRAIKRDAIAETMAQHRPFIAVIPCRKFYDFCPDVWKQEIRGKTLLEYSIERCLRSQHFDHIVVACDNIEAQKVMEKYKDPRLSFHLRSSEETIRSRPLATTLEKIVRVLDPALKGLTVVSYVPAPFVSTETLEEALFTLVMNQTDCSIGVEEMRNAHLLKRTAYGLQSLNTPKNELVTDFDRIYRESFTALATKNKNFQNGSLTGPSIVSFIVNSDELHFVDTERNLKIARVISEDMPVREVPAT